MLLFSAPLVAEPLPVAVSIPPQKALVEEIGGEHVKIEVLLRPGQDPHHFEATPRQISDITRSKLYFSLQLPFEKQLLERLSESAPGLKIVDTARDIERLTMSGHDHDHEHHDHGDHSEDHSCSDCGGDDPHIWLDPLRLKKVAEHVAAALKEADPDRASAYEEGLDRCLARLEKIDADMSKALEKLNGRAMLVYHPAFGYLTERHGMKQVAIEDEGKAPTPKQLRALLKETRQDGAEPIEAIFVQPEFGGDAAESVAKQLGFPIVMLNPLAQDLWQNLPAMAHAIAEKG